MILNVNFTFACETWKSVYSFLWYFFFRYFGISVTLLVGYLANLPGLFLLISIILIPFTGCPLVRITTKKFVNFLFCCLCSLCFDLILTLPELPSFLPPEPDFSQDNTQLTISSPKFLFLLNEIIFFYYSFFFGHSSHPKMLLSSSVFLTQLAALSLVLLFPENVVFILPHTFSAATPLLWPFATCLLEVFLRSSLVTSNKLREIKLT